MKEIWEMTGGLFFTLDVLSFGSSLEIRLVKMEDLMSMYFEAIVKLRIRR
jgi:hypothetical protein